jgi:RNA polymerase sigma factor (sigma-70 family)
MSTTMATEDPTGRTVDPLADPGLRRALEDFVRRRVSAPDVDDVVQTVLCDALAADGRPRDPAELRRWLIGIARHKVADHHRRAAREELSEAPELPAPPPPIEAREMARWAERQVASTRDAKQTLAWMAREGEGEKLESIAADEQVPAARVRQRVSRMRRWMKERWLAELAAVAALAVLAVLVARLLRRDDAPQIAPMPEPPPTALPEPSPLDRARALRAEAFEACGREAWQECLRKLDEAAGLDPDGDRAPEVTEARDRARRAIQRERDDANEKQKDDKDSVAPPPPTDAKTATPVKAPLETKPFPTSTTPTTTPAPRPKKPTLTGKEKLSSDADFPSKGGK